jgi:autotransporter-associated beta strand protein
MTTKSGMGIGRAAGLVTVTVMLAAPWAFGSGIWDGGGVNANWLTANNWDDNVVPAGGSSVTLGTAFTSGTTIGGFNGRHVGTLTIDTTHAFTLSDDSIYIDAGITRTASSSGIQTLNIWNQYTALRTGGPNTWNNNSTSGKLVIQGMIRYDGGGVTFNGPGTTEFLGSYGSQSGGALTLNDGTLLFNKSASVNVLGGTLTIGDGIGAAESAVVRIPVGNTFSQLSSGNPLVMKADGLLELNQANNAVLWAQMTGGRITTTTGLLSIYNSGNNTITTVASANSALIEGRVAFPTASNYNTIDVADGAAADDLVINANIGQFGHALHKAGTGTLVLGGSNSYTTGSYVDNGTLIVTANNALGTTAAGTTVGSGCTLGFRGNVNYTTAEAVSAVGTGVGGVGAINNVGGTNTFAGAVSFSADVTIGASSGRLNLLGNFTDTGAGWRALTKVGTGTVALSGVVYPRNYSSVSAGTLLINGVLSNNYTFGFSVSSGATLGGTGTVTCGLSLPSGATLAPGDPVGTLTLTNNASGLVFNSGSTNFVRIAGVPEGQYGQIKVSTGPVTLGSATLVIDGTGFRRGAARTLVWLVNKESAGAVSGTFAGLAEGVAVMVGNEACTITYQANYPAGFTGGNDVALIVPPRPSGSTFKFR